MLALVAGSVALVVPTMPVAPMVQQTVAATPVVADGAASYVFPSTFTLAKSQRISGSFSDLLDDEAEVQSARDAEIEAKKQVAKKRQEEEEAKKAAEYQAALKFQAEQQAKKEALQAANKAKKEAAELAKAEEAEKRAAKQTEMAAKGGGAPPKAASPSSKPEKFAKVETVDKRAERVAARIAAGEEGPTFFGL